MAGTDDDRPRLSLDEDKPVASPYLHPPYREPVRMAVARVSRAELGRLGRELRAMYEALLMEPVPDHLIALIHRLEQRG